MSQKEQLFKGIHLPTSSWISWSHDKSSSGTFSAVIESKASWMTVLVFRFVSWNLVMFFFYCKEVKQLVIYTFINLWNLFEKTCIWENVLFHIRTPKDQYVGIRTFTSYIYSVINIPCMDPLGNVRWETVLLAMAMGTLVRERGAVGRDDWFHSCFNVLPWETNPFASYQTPDMNKRLLVIRLIMWTMFFPLGWLLSPAIGGVTSGFYEVKLHHDWNGEIMG